MRLSDLAKAVDFDLIGGTLGQDVRRSLEEALAGDAIFDGGGTPLDIFRRAVDAAIRDVSSHPRGELLQRFLVEAPYERDGDIPDELAAHRLTDNETAAVTAFVRMFMVSSFQGRLAELVAAAPAVHLLRRLQQGGAISRNANLYIGDAVMAPQTNGRGRAKAGDVHVLERSLSEDGAEAVKVCAVGEIKSHRDGESKVHHQLKQHLARCQHGLTVEGKSFPPDRITVDPDQTPSFWVVPASWKLPREFRFEERGGRTLLHVEPSKDPTGKEKIDRTATGRWRITVRWSHEALAAAAFDLTFWYMERVGEAAFTTAGANPWPEMTPAEAGRNAATSALYYAIRRSEARYEAEPNKKNRHERSRAIALYNMYGFGYALGMNFYDAKRRRKMLWVQDLREILANGTTADGYRIAR